MSRKYYAAVRPVSVAVVQVFRTGYREWAIGYRSSFEKRLYNPIAQVQTYSSPLAAQNALDELARDKGFKDFEEV